MQVVHVGIRPIVENRKPADLDFLPGITHPETQVLAQGNRSTRIVIAGLKRNVEALPRASGRISEARVPVMRTRSPLEDESCDALGLAPGPE
jgi:hypothetical protein